MNSHHDAPSEDGLDDAPPCPSAYMTSDKRMLIFSDKADAMEWDDSKDLLPLYSLDELNRIVAAKDAEIAKFKEANRELAESNVRRRDKIVELTRKLDAQPARQAGGDEREYHCDYAGCSQKAHPGTSLCLKHHTPKARAAIAKARGEA